MSIKYRDYFFKTYLNPVYSESFPDPFVLKYCGEYFAYCTGIWRDGLAFGVLHSRDLVNWTEIGGAMRPLKNSAPYYWAPEVIYSNGKFYLYYSVGNEIFMEIRVAISERPDGGFVDTGKRLTKEEFAIDPHIFIDSDGQKYFFYATDFLTHTHIGTGTVVDKMIDWVTLEGNPQPVTRARFDWQVYDPQRREKGGVRWHTVEGAYVLKRKGIYYEMFSGGNWQNPTYGVSFAVTDDIEKPEEWEQFSDGVNILPILRTIPGEVVGPGHNSVIRGLNNRELFCVYHRWVDDKRVMAIDRMDFAGGNRIFINGATNSPQPSPFAPGILDFFDKLSAGKWKIAAGNWNIETNQLISEKSESAEIICRQKAESFLLETSLRLIEGADGRFGIFLRDSKIKVWQIFFEPAKQRAAINWFENEEQKMEEIDLSDDFDFRAVHLLRVETDYFSVRVWLDERLVFSQQNLQKVPLRFSLVSENCRAAFSGTALTVGFENLFEHDDLECRGWRKIAGSGYYRMTDQNLVVTNNGDSKTVFFKGIPKKNYELCVNFCLLNTFGENFRFGFYPAFDEKKEFPFFSFALIDQKWELIVENDKYRQHFQLPFGLKNGSFQQFGFLKVAEKIFIRQENLNLGVVNIPEKNTKIAFSVQNAALAFDMIRVTAI